MNRSWTALPTLAGTAALLLAVGACSSASSTAAGGGDGKPVVVTSFYPLAFATSQIAGGAVDVSVLTKPGAEPHDLELGAQDIVAMTKARLVIYADGFQPAVDDATAQVEPSHLLDVAAAADLTLEATEDGHEHADTGAAQQGAQHDHAGDDPHFWLDPHRYAAVAKAIGLRLAADDPANATTYAKNTDAFVAKLTTLDREYRVGLKTCTNKVIVTSHSAFGYLAQRYGLQQHGIAGLSPEVEPSAAGLKEINDLVRTKGITTVYQETLVEGRFAETVATSTGAKLATLDPIEGINDKSAGSDYFEVMRSNLSALRQGQGCR
ncbi:MAG: metal ABC transporter substrate-binding protein [Humibacillus sp.]|nr:metal ABC transporter substrate-binding protein [Humibacillus sp.]MDN5779772.1 metal ABC transporter substrate-binding protein [Humibacillus sp.]